MTLIPEVGATSERPTDAITFEELDGSNRYSFQLVNGLGKTDPLRFVVNPYPRSVTQISQGSSDYDDYRPPYKPIAAVDWNGGRGQDRFEDDRTRYLEGYRVDTTQSGVMFNGPQETWSKGTRAADVTLPGDVDGFTTLSSASTYRYISAKFTASESYTANAVVFVAKKVGTPTGDLTVYIYSDSAGEPNTTLGTIGTYSRDNLTNDAKYCVLIGTGGGVALTGGTDYHLVFAGPIGTDTAAFAVATGSTASGFNSANGSTWSAATSAPYGAIYDNAATFGGKYFEYKSALYFLTQPEDKSASSIYLNGDRGVTSSAASTTLTDSTKSWTTNEWAGTTLYVQAGTGVGQRRTVSSNTGTVLTVSEAWDVTPDTTSDYVILGADSWQSVDSLSNYATDVAVVGENIYVSFGVGTAIVRRRWWSPSTTWDKLSATESAGFEADYLLPLLDPDRGPELWGTLNDHPLHGVCFWRASAPPLWGPLHTDLGEIAPTNQKFDEGTDITVNITNSVSATTGNATIALGASWTTGVMASKQISPTDIREGTHVAMNVKSDVAITAGKLEVYLDDTLYKDLTIVPSAIFTSAVTNITPDAAMVGTSTNSLSKPDGLLLGKSHHYNYPLAYFTKGSYQLATQVYEQLSSGSYTDHPNMYNGQANNGDAITLANNEYLYVGHTERFSKIKFDFATPVNANTSNMVLQAFDGEKFTDVTVNSDGTKVSAATWAQDGVIDFDADHFEDLVEVNNQELYWIRMSPSSTLTTNVVVREISVWSKDLRFETVEQNEMGEPLTSAIGHKFYMDDDPLVRYGVLVGYTEKFDELHFDLGGDVNNNASTIVVRYPADRQWTAPSNITDTTTSGGATMAQDGSVSFSMPADWEQVVLTGQDTAYYWVWISATAATDVIGLYQIAVRNRSKMSYFALDFEPDQNTYTAAQWGSDGKEIQLDLSKDGIFVGHSEKFTAVNFVVATANAATATLTAKYWTGYEWDTIANQTDGTISTADSLETSGAISWGGQLAEWEATTIEGVTGYWVKLETSAALSAGVRDIYITAGHDTRFYDILQETQQDDRLEAQLHLEAGDFIYIGHSSPYASVFFGVETASSGGGTLSHLEWSTYDEGWTDVISYAEGTVDSTDAGTGFLTRGGSITIGVFHDWRKLTINGVEGYWLRFRAGGSVNALLNEIYIAPLASVRPHGQDIKDASALTPTYPLMTYQASWSQAQPLVIVSPQPFSGVTFTVSQANTSRPSQLIVAYWDGTTFTSVGNITDNTDAGTGSLEQSGTATWDSGIPNDWEEIDFFGVTGYVAKLYFINSQKYDVSVQAISVQIDAKDVVSLDPTTHTAGDWAFCYGALTKNGKFPWPNSAAIQSVRLANTADDGAENLEFEGGLRLMRLAPEITPLASDVPITGMAAYGRVKANPWILTEKRPFEVIINDQTQATTAIPIPLGELDSVRSQYNGQAAITNDVYLYFNLAQHLQRYFEGSLENIGPNRDEGLPENRQGNIKRLVSYPGRVFAVVDGEDDGYSSVLVRRGSGWHEMYRAPYGQTIEDGWVQVTPGAEPDRFWMVHSGAFVYFDLPSYTFNPLQDSSYEFTHESHLITSWIDGGFINIEKLFTSIELTSKNLTSNVTVTAYYQTNSGDLETNNITGWIPLPTVFTTSPYQEVNIATNYVSANKIRFKFVLNTNDNATTPVIEAVILNAIVNLPVKYSYPLRIRVQDDDTGYTGHNDWARAETKYSQLKTWTGVPPIPVKMRSPYSSHDNITGVLQAPSGRPLFLEENTQNEGWIIDILFLEI